MNENKPYPYRPLESERMYYRMMEEKDLPDLFEMRSNPELMRFIPRPIAKSVDEMVDMLEMISDTIDKGEGMHWGMFYKANDKLIGGIGYYRCQQAHFRGELGYMLHMDYHKKGLMKEAVELILDYGFNEMNFHSIEAHINPNNEPSIKTVLRYGFVKEAHFRENTFHNGAFEDTAVYSLLKSKRNS